MSESKAKSIFASKTFWANILMSIAPVIDVLTGNEVFSIPPEYYAMVITVVNLVLRFLTKQPVKV